MWWPHYSRDKIQKLLDTFPSFNVSWDYSLVGGSNNQLMLEPGYLYTLTAVVSVVPIHQQDRLERVSIDTWRSKTLSTSVERVVSHLLHFSLVNFPLGPSRSNTCWHSAMLSAHIFVTLTISFRLTFATED